MCGGDAVFSQITLTICSISYCYDIILIIYFFRWICQEVMCFEILGVLMTEYLLWLQTWTLLEHFK